MNDQNCVTIKDSVFFVIFLALYHTENHELYKGL